MHFFQTEDRHGSGSRYIQALKCSLKIKPRAFLPFFLMFLVIFLVLSGSQDFQQWSFQPENHSKKMTDHKVWSTYKEPLKEYIFRYTEARFSRGFSSRMARMRATFARS